MFTEEKVFLRQVMKRYLNEFNTASMYWHVAHIENICKNENVFSRDVCTPLETCRNNYGALLTAEKAGIGTPLFVHTTLQDEFTHKY
jgi:hypothetical protein